VHIEVDVLLPTSQLLKFMFLPISGKVHNLQARYAYRSICFLLSYPMICVMSQQVNYYQRNWQKM
jgi:hypothetical protein